jgi:hypothetical protein
MFIKQLDIFSNNNTIQYNDYVNILTSILFKTKINYEF